MAITYTHDAGRDKTRQTGASRLAYHTTGYVDGNRLVLFDVAMKLITVEGDVLTVIDAGSDGTDLPFTRQTSANAVPASCRL